MQEFDKDYSPVNLEFMPSGSVASIIESLCHEDIQSKGTTGPWTPTGDSLVTQPISLSRIGIEEDQDASKETVVSREKSEGVAADNVAAEKPHNDEQSPPHAQCSHEGNDLHPSSAFNTTPVLSPLEMKSEALMSTSNSLRTNAHSHDRGENKL